MHVFAEILHTLQVVRRYHIQDREDYKKYNKLCGMITKLTSLLQRLEPTDEDRIQVTDELIDKCASVHIHYVYTVARPT